MIEKCIFRTATNFQQNKSVHLLIKAGVHVNTFSDTGHTPIHIAAINCYVEILQLLLSAGADTSLAEYFQGFAPLHSAVLAGTSKNDPSEFKVVFEGCVEGVRILVEGGASVNVKTYKGEMPYDLLQSGTDFDPQTQRTLFAILNPNHRDL